MYIAEKADYPWLFFSTVIDKTNNSCCSSTSLEIFLIFDICVGFNGHLRDVVTVSKLIGSIYLGHFRYLNIREGGGNAFTNEMIENS